MPQIVSHARMKSALAGFTAVALSASLMVPSLAYAEPSSAEKQAEAQTTLASLNAMQSKLDQAANTYDDALKNQHEAEANRDAAQNRIDEANGQIADLQNHLGSRARSMYRTGNATILDVLLGSTTFDSFTTNWDILNSMNQSDATMVQQAKDLRAEVQKQEKAYAEQQRVATEKADEAKHAKDDTASTMAAMQATYDSLSAEATELLNQERAAQQAVEAANAPKVVQQAVDRADGTGTGGPSTPNSPNTSGGPSPAPPLYKPSTGNAVVDRAYSQLGKAYGYHDLSHGAGPNEYDCSGFVAYCLTGSYSRLGSTHTLLGWPHVSDPQPGDIAVNSEHTGVYIGNGQMIHAATYGVGVIQGPVQGGMVFVRPPW